MTPRNGDGSEFPFKGVKRDPNSVRSMEKIDRCWRVAFALISHAAQHSAKNLHHHLSIRRRKLALLARLDCWYGCGFWLRVLSLLLL